jgi:cephalosporin hydroxylase
VAPEVVDEVAGLVRPNETVLVILDSNHGREHVRNELEAYHRLVSPGFYIAATDGIMRDVWNTPGEFRCGRMTIQVTLRAISLPCIRTL